MADPTPENFRRTDDYLAGLLLASDPAMDAALAAQRSAGLPDIEVSPLQGKMLSLLARLCGARRVLEVGTLGGYSTTWLARAVGEGGMVVTIEAEERHAAIARANVDAAGIGSRVEIVQGRASEVLSTLQGPFDLVFIDADKESNTVYLDWAARLGRPGTVIILDNVVRAGEIVVENHPEGHVSGTQQGLRMLAEDPRFDAAALQTVGVKGWDGLAIAIVTAEAAH